MKKLALLTLFAGSLAFSACGAEGEDPEIADLPLATGEEKADAPSAAGPYLWVRPDGAQIRCIKAPCPERAATPVNGGTASLVYKFDWRSLRLSQASQAQASLKVSSLLLRGRFMPTTAQGQPVVVFQVVRALEPASTASFDSVAQDRYYGAAGVQCVAPPCTTVQATMVNDADGRRSLWDRVDLQRLRLSASQQAALTQELQGGKAYVSVRAVANQAADVTQVFRPLFSAPLR